jgi:MATE family multidrug resistance protein
LSAGPGPGRDPRSLAASARRIAPLAWPVFVGQLSVLAFSTVDTVLLARHDPLDLAALAVGAAAYVTVFIGFMGVVLALGPIVGQFFGAGRLREAGEHLHQALWVALGLAVLGVMVLAFPAPFLHWSQASPALEARIRPYLLALACSLPASLLFTVYRGFNTAVSRPKAVMVLQLSGLALKVPLSAALAYGVPALGVPSLGVVGCGIATAIAMWAQAIVALVVLARDPFYRVFELFSRGLDAPDRKALATHLRLGLPIGGAVLIEVSGFTFMAIFIARLGALPVAGHQIAANLVALLFMMPLALSNATSTLVAQRIGAQDMADARRLGWHGLLIAGAMALAMGGGVYLAREQVVGLYTRDAAIAAAALPLVAWVALFHLADALQTMAGFVLRAWRIATVTLVVYAGALWGVGLAGGYVLAFDLTGSVPAAWQGAPGFWVAATTGLWVAALALGGYLVWLLRRQRAAARAAVSSTAA